MGLFQAFKNSVSALTIATLALTASASAQTASQMGKPLFTNNILNGVSFGGNAARAPSGDPTFANTSRSIKLWPNGWAYAQIQTNDILISDNNKFLHFYVRRGSIGSGNLRIQANGWNTDIGLTSDNANFLAPNGEIIDTNVSTLEDLNANEWFLVSVNLQELGVTELNALVLQGNNNENVTYYIDEVGLHPIEQVFNKALFLDDYKSNASAWINSGNVLKLTNNNGANSTQTSLFIQPSTQDFAGLLIDRNLNANQRYLHFYVQHEPDAEGDIVITHGNNWQATYLTSQNASSWWVNDEQASDGLNSLAPYEWHKVVVDLEALSISHIRGLGFIGDSNDAPANGGGNYFFDTVGLAATSGIEVQEPPPPIEPAETVWLFDDDYQNGASPLSTQNGETTILSTGYGAQNSQSSLFLRPNSYQFLGLEVNRTLVENQKTLKFFVQREVNSDGELAIIEDYGNPVYLSASNSSIWKANGQTPNGGLSTLSTDEWHEIEVDLDALSFEDLTAITVLGDGDDNPQTGNGKYFLDQVRLESSAVSIPGKCMNMGSYFDAPVLDPENGVYPSNYWGYEGQDINEVSADFQTIKAAGFDTIRLPIRWTRFAGEQANNPDASNFGDTDHHQAYSGVYNRANPYDFTIEPAAFTEIDPVINAALNEGLKVIINVHHAKGFNQDWDATHDALTETSLEAERLKSIWQQLSSHYQNFDSKLIFEIINEPNLKEDGAEYDANGNLIGMGNGVQVMNNLNTEVLASIRTNNPTRKVILGSSHWGGMSPFQVLSNGNYFNPDYDPNVILTFHYYEPFSFTHNQGSEFGTTEEYDALYQDFWQIKEFQDSPQGGKGMPIFIGEFGSQKGSPVWKRSQYAEAIRDAADNYGFGWCYWEFSGAPENEYFEIYDSENEEWIGDIKDKLIPNN